MDNSLSTWDERELLKILVDPNVTRAETEEVCKALEEKPIDRVNFCGYVWDGILCWYPVPSGNLAVQSCMEEFNEVKYDTTANATKQCLENGTWNHYTDYLSCQPNKGVEVINGVLPETEITTYIYVIGYCTSLLVLLAAVWIFLYFKDLRCLRNTIHINLMSTYILADVMWILNASLQTYAAYDLTSCVFLVVSLHYSQLTTFYWMFVEGLYLYMLVVETFTRENIKLRTYLIIGWGAPFVVIVGWMMVRGILQNPSADDSACPWMVEHPTDYIYATAAILVLALNLIFLIMIMWVLITKLRSSNNVETQQYRKAAKALIVLIPLLGVTYMLLLVSPAAGEWDVFFQHTRAGMLSTQGLMVALLYCFFNAEVQNTLRHHISRWKEAREIGHRRYNYSKDWSPNTRTESIRSSECGTTTCIRRSASGEIFVAKQSADEPSQV